MSKDSSYIDHHIAQAWGVNFDLLNNKATLIKTSHQAALELNLNIVNTFVHRFKPHGLSLILVISESHFAIHTWPELGYMHVDVVSCCQGSSLNLLPKVLKKLFNPEKITCQKIDY